MTKTLALAILATLTLSACDHYMWESRDRSAHRYDRDSYFMGSKGGKVYPGDKLSDEGRDTYKGGKQ